MVREVQVYALVDPRDGATRYVGRSVNPGARLSGHLTESHWGSWGGVGREPIFNAKDRWLRELEALGLRPTLLVLDVVPWYEGPEAEQAWIVGCLEMGDRLLNMQDAWGFPLVREVSCAA